MCERVSPEKESYFRQLSIQICHQPFMYSGRQLIYVIYFYISALCKEDLAVQRCPVKWFENSSAAVPGCPCTHHSLPGVFTSPLCSACLSYIYWGVYSLWKCGRAHCYKTKSFRTRTAQQPCINGTCLCAEMSDLK